MEDKNITRERILKVTVKLLLEEKDYSSITIRKIAALAETGVGSVNYHFRTKEDLVNEAVRVFVNKAIADWYPQWEKSELPAVERLRLMMKGTAGFLAAYPRISRISILRDFENPRSNDNISMTEKVYKKVIAEAFPDRTAEERREILVTIVASIQSAFLRYEINMESTEFDFFDKEQRENFVDRIIGYLI